MILQHARLEPIIEQQHCLADGDDELALNKAASTVRCPQQHAGLAAGGADGADPERLVDDGSRDQAGGGVQCGRVDVPGGCRVSDHLAFLVRE